MSEENKELALKIGRPCCGSRTMCLSQNGESHKSKFVDFREFKGWHCSVNWFFMHIEQQTDSVFHHRYSLISMYSPAKKLTMHTQFRVWRSSKNK
jgi:hypothetical protein